MMLRKFETTSQTQDQINGLSTGVTNWIRN